MFKVVVGIIQDDPWKMFWAAYVLLNAYIFCVVFIRVKNIFKVTNG